MENIKYLGNSPQIHVGSRKYIPLGDILHLESDINYTHILLANGNKILSSTTLKIIENRLSPFKNFVRINRQTIVNMNWVNSIENHVCLLVNNQKKTFSRRRAKHFKILIERL